MRDRWAVLAIRLLGTEEARDTGGRVVEELLRQPKRFALLAYLAAAEPLGFHRRDVLLGLLWPDTDPDHARHALNQALYFLRHALGHDVLVTRGACELALDTDVVSCDVWSFRRAIADGDLERAVAGYSGPLLGGFASGTSAVFEHWVDGERDRLSRSYMTALEHLAEACAAQGAHQEEVAWWRRLAEHDPYRTHVTLRLMAALETVGDRAGALEQAARHAARLREDLDAEPSPDVVSYAERLRNHPLPHDEIVEDLLTRVTRAVGQRYTIERELGSGGVATVYLAHDVRNRRQVALKVLCPEFQDALGAELFLREMRITAALHHPLILPLLDSGEADGVLYYAMPYVEGESLRERLRREGLLPIDQSVAIAREVAEALGFAHDHDIVHRDVKPENILLDAGHAVIADFGVTGAIASAGDAACLDRLVDVGTATYMSPEQAEGAADLDGRADLYSLGCVLYEMLAGTPPFTGSTVEELVRQHRSAEPPAVTAIRPLVPAGVVEALDRSLAKAPADRFSSAAEFGEALAPSTALTPPGFVRVDRRARRRRLMVGGGVGVAAVVAAVGATLLLPGAAGERLDPNRVFVARFADETGLEASGMLGYMVQDYIIQILTDAGFAKVADPLTTLAVTQDVAAAGMVAGREEILRLANEAEVGTVVSGSYHVEGDSVYVQARISDANDASVVRTVGPQVGAAGAPSELVARLGQKVVAALAAHLDGDIGAWEPTVQPATYGAYTAYTEGLEMIAGGRAAGAARRFERATAADPTFYQAALWAAQSYQVAGRYEADSSHYATADSLIAMLVEKRRRLTRHERCRLDFVMALGPRLDLAAAYEGARCMARAAPGSNSATHELALFAYRFNRPAEAVGFLGELDPDRGVLKHCGCYWPVLTAAYHMLGDYKRELDAARQAWQRFGESPALEIPALAALGRLDDVAANLEMMRWLPARSSSFRLHGFVYGEYPPKGTQTLGGYLGYVALVLRTHGHRDAAREVFDEAIAWFRSRQHDTDVSGALHAWLLYQAERWDDAGRLIDDLIGEDPGNTAYLAVRGRLAARRGDREEALRISETLRSLEHPHLERSHILERARIAALLGEREQTMTLLQQAIDGGVNWGHGLWLRRDIDLEPLHDYPPFQEFLRPKG